MNKSKQNNRLVAGLCLGIGVVLLVISLWGVWEDTWQLSQQLPFAVIALCSIGVGIQAATSKNKKE